LLSHCGCDVLRYAPEWSPGDVSREIEKAVSILRGEEKWIARIDPRNLSTCSRPTRNIGRTCAKCHCLISIVNESSKFEASVRQQIRFGMWRNKHSTCGAEKYLHKCAAGKHTPPMIISESLREYILNRSTITQ
jgi:hypothetical protein